MSTRQNNKPRRKQRRRPVKVVVRQPPPAPRRARRRQRKRPQEGFFSKALSFVSKGIPMVIKAITGFGDYKVQQNSLMTGGMSPPEVMNSMSNGGFILRHREYIGDVLSTTNFTLNSYVINPGIQSTFPWLSAVAAGFEQYKVRGMVFEYKSTSSNAVLSTSASTGLGTVIMATSYNPGTVDFVDKRTMENYQFASSADPSKTFYHPIECARAQTPVSELYVRTGSVPSNQDLRLYDLGTFYLATQGMQNADSSAIGELWCTFEIELFKPKLVNSLGITILSDHWTSNSAASATPLGGAIISSSSTLGGTISGQTFSWPEGVVDGTYVVYTEWTGTTATVEYPVQTRVACTALQIFEGLATGTMSTPPNGTAASKVAQLTLLTIGSGASITWGSAGTLPAGGTLDLLVLQTPPFTNLLEGHASESTSSDDESTSAEDTIFHGYTSQQLQKLFQEFLAHNTGATPSGPKQ